MAVSRPRILRRLTSYIAPVVVLVLASVAFATGNAEFNPVDLIGFAAILGVSLLGVVIRNHQPGNRIAFLLQATAVLLLVSSLGISGGDVETVSDPNLWDYMRLLSEAFGIFGIGAMFLILFLFPDGTFLNARWRWLGRLFGVALALLFFVTAFSDHLGDVWQDAPALANPIGIVPWEVTVWVSSISAPIMLGMALSGVIALILRYRRSGAVVRAQIKWVLLAAILMVLTFPAAVTDHALSDVSFTIFFALLPVSLTLAITQYRLFDIDRLISRTISYAIVVAVLAAGFVGLTILSTSILGAQSSLAVAGSTLAAAALFNPLRRRIQDLVERRFNRSSYEAQQISEEFAARLLKPHSAEEVATMLNATIDEVLQPRVSAVWLRTD